VSEVQPKIVIKIKTVPVRKKALILLFSLLVNLLAVGFDVAIHQRVSWSSLILPTLFAVLLLTLRCNRCGKFVYANMSSIIGSPFTYNGWPIIPGTCAQCGKDFAEPEI